MDWYGEDRAEATEQADLLLSTSVLLLLLLLSAPRAFYRAVETSGASDPRQAVEEGRAKETQGEEAEQEEEDWLPVQRVWGRRSGPPGDRPP